jgi:hypothetical protein
MVSVLVIVPSFRGFKLGRSDGYLRAIKIRNTSSFGGEVKLSAPYCKVLLLVKITSS